MAATYWRREKRRKRYLFIEMDRDLRIELFVIAWFMSFARATNPVS